MESRQKLEYPGLDGNVERRGRLIEQKESWLDGERARNANALPLAAGELGRARAKEPSGQSDTIKQVLDACEPFASRPDSLSGEGEHDNVAYCFPWIEGRQGVLKNHLHVPLDMAPVARPSLRDVTTKYRHAAAPRRG